MMTETKKCQYCEKGYSVWYESPHGIPTHKYLLGLWPRCTDKPAKPELFKSSQPAEA